MPAGSHALGAAPLQQYSGYAAPTSSGMGGIPSDLALDTLVVNDVTIASELRFVPDNTVDIGRTNERARNLYVGTDAKIDQDVLVGRDIRLTNNLVFKAPSAEIIADTLPGADNFYLNFSGGGDSSPTRGSRFQVFGNQYPANEGHILAFMGNPTTAAFRLITGESQDILKGYNYNNPIPARQGTVELPAGRLQFAATPIQSPDPYTMDCWRELAWSPIDASGAGLALTNVSGVYLKFGPWILAEATFGYPATASGFAASVGGLPAVAANYGAAFVGYTTLAGNFNVLVSTTLLFYKDGSGLTNAALSGKDFRLVAVYRATA